MRPSAAVRKQLGQTMNVIEHGFRGDLTSWINPVEAKRSHREARSAKKTKGQDQQDAQDEERG